ncbi:family 43 glycosylhydrolase [Caulobacter sp. 73W]|uniref:Family 43 glycosylhydrolase n=1 Tax=Caulobacter sp. 73W TaxID=3161137 RepID=A0AB39KYF7_9CAUL
MIHTLLRRRELCLGVAAAAFAPAIASKAWAQTVYGDAPPPPGRPLADDVDNSRRIIPAPRSDYWPYSGISGAGAPVTRRTQGGGWVSGMPDVRYQGPEPRTYPTAPWGGSSSGSVVKDGLLPPIRPIWDAHIRDTIIRPAPDGSYYMTGSTGDNIWAVNDGVELWRSRDLATWDYLGLVWSIDRDGTWEKNWTMRKGVPFRAIWAPEIHYVAGSWVICTSISGVGVGLLKSISGKPEGPYKAVISDTAPIRGSIDSTLFEDDNGRVWLTFGAAEAVREIKRDFSAFAGDWIPLVYDDSVVHTDAQGRRRMGFEGATLFKRDGRYYLGVVHKTEGRYSFAFAMSDKLLGPYHTKHEGVPGGGGGNVFKDHKGRWWQTYFGNDDAAPFREKPGLVRIDFDAAGKIVVAKDQPFLVMA